MKKFTPGLLVVVLVAAAYAPALRNGFVWDDTALVLRDPLIRSWRLIPEGFQHFLFTDATASDFYRPIQRLTYTLDYGAFAFHPWGYHLTSLLCHIGAALAFLFCARQLLRRFGVAERARDVAAFGATLAWALHPAHNAAVSYVAGRADPLAAMFGFLALSVALRGEGKSWLWSGGAAVLLLLSALSKESGLIFPVLWLAVLWWEQHWKTVARWAVVVAIVVTSYLALRLPAEHIPAPNWHAPAPLLVRPIVAARALAEYAAVIVAPIHLRMERDVETRPHGSEQEMATTVAWRELETIVGVLLLGAIVSVAIMWRREQPATICLLLLAAVAYLPVSGLFALNATVAEHWLYLPSAFLFLGIGVAIVELTEGRRSASLVGASLILWIAFLGARTFFRAFDWKDQRTFFERTISTGGATPRMLINLAGLEMMEGNLAAARQHVQAALEKEPAQPIALINLAAVAIKQRDFKAAHEALDRAVTIPFVEAQAHELRVVLEHQELGTTNMLRMRLASRTGPANWEIENRYLRLLDENGATAQAIAELQGLLQREWYRSESWELLSVLLQKVGRNSEAATAMQRAREYDVHFAANVKSR